MPDRLPPETTVPTTPRRKTEIMADIMRHAQRFNQGAIPTARYSDVIADLWREYDNIPNDETKMTEKIWTCKVGALSEKDLPYGADLPMRQAVQQAFFDLAGYWPKFTFSGWDGKLTEGERAVVENRLSDLALLTTSLLPDSDPTLEKLLDEVEKWTRKLPKPGEKADLANAKAYTAARQALKDWVSKLEAERETYRRAWNKGDEQAAPIKQDRGTRWTCSDCGASATYDEKGWLKCPCDCNTGGTFTPPSDTGEQK